MPVTTLPRVLSISRSLGVNRHSLAGIVSGEDLMEPSTLLKYSTISRCLYHVVRRPFLHPAFEELEQISVARAGAGCSKPTK